MEKYLADRSYALIYRMCQVQVFSSRLHARGFPAIGKYGPKTPPRTAGVTKCVIGFGRYSGFVRRFCRERPIRATQKPVARAFLAPGLRKAEPDSRTLRSLPLFSLSFSGSIAGICKSPKRSACPDRKPSVADRKIVAFGCRTGPEYRLLSGRSGSRPAPEPPPRRSPSEASYSVRTDTAIICFVMWRTYPPRSCDISQPRLEVHRPCLRPASGREVSADGRKLARESRYVRAYDSERRRLACRVWNKRPFPVQRPSRATSASSLSRYCPYWFLSMGSATSRSFSSDIHPLR